MKRQIVPMFFGVLLNLCGIGLALMYISKQDEFNFTTCLAIWVASLGANAIDNSIRSFFYPKEFPRTTYRIRITKEQQNGEGHEQAGEEDEGEHEHEQ